MKVGFQVKNFRTIGKTPRNPILSRPSPLPTFFAIKFDIALSVTTVSRFTQQQNSPKTYQIKLDTKYIGFKRIQLFVASIECIAGS